MSLPYRKAPHALIVEDDQAIREALAECIEDFEFEVSTARDGVEALDFLRGGRRPDLILLDLRMPRRDGDEVLSAIRGDPALAGLFVVAMTASNERPALPVQGFLQKPFKMEELAQVLALCGAQRES